MSIRRKIQDLLKSNPTIQEELTPIEVSKILQYIEEIPLKATTHKKANHYNSLSNLKIEHLTKRQLHIFKLIGMGLHSKEIAQELNLSLSTVTTHRKNIIKRLELKGAGQLQRVAQKHFLIIGK